MFDDVLQEGPISTWKLNDHASTGYMIVTARHAMNGVLTWETSRRSTRTGAMR